jgi:opacity protein-like surface antigen
MSFESQARRWRLPAALAMLAILAVPHAARAQGFISPSFGYNFGGDAGCRTATDCENKNWNWGVSFGALGSILGFEGEITYDGKFTGENTVQTSKLTTFMGNLMLAPKISIVQPFGLVGIGGIKTEVEDVVATTSDSETHIGWTIGGGVIIYVQKHVGLKGDIRYYHSFEATDLLGFDIGSNNNKVDFGRAAFGVVFKF